MNIDGARCPFCGEVPRIEAYSSFTYVSCDCLSSRADTEEKAIAIYEEKQRNIGRENV